MTRVYLPTFAELIDRLTIIQLKAIFISGNQLEYKREMEMILRDIDSIIEEKDFRIKAKEIHAIACLAFTNIYIWLNESKAREGGSECDHLLKLTHSINGQRNTAKNVIAKSIGDRLDFKVDSFAASLIDAYGHWQIWSDEK